MRRDGRPHPRTGLPYPEERFQAIGRIGTRMVMLVFTPAADGFRVISLRPADRREREAWHARYPTSTTPPG